MKLVESTLPRKADVIVVGAGPAGSAAAHAVAAGGVECLLLEREDQPGLRAVCGGGVSPRLLDLAQELGVIKQELRRMVFWEHPAGGGDLPDGATFRARYTWQSRRPLGFTVDRREFDRAMAERATRAGSRLSVGVRVRGWQAENGSLLVECRNRDGTHQVSCRALILADGPRTLNRDSWDLGTGSGRDAREMVAVTGEVEAPRAIETLHAFFHPKSVGWGYYWIFPHRGMLNVGVGGLTRFVNTDLRSALRRFCSTTPLLEGQVPERIIGGILPVGEGRRCPVEGVIPVGDAAGLVNPFTGAGIHHAVSSGALAGAAVAWCLRRGAPLRMARSVARLRPGNVWLRMLDRLKDRMIGPGDPGPYLRWIWIVARLGAAGTKR